MTRDQVIEFLWDLLDHIDTLDDAIKQDDAAFRVAVRKAQRRRFETGITTDGYDLDMSALSDFGCASVKDERGG